MKRSNDLFGKIGMFLLLINLFVTLICMLFFSRGLYRFFFQTRHLEAETDLTLAEADQAHAALVAYLNRRKENILVADQPFFNERETRHMQDVQTLVSRVRFLQITFALGGGLLLAVGLRREDKREALREYIGSVLTAIGALLLFALVWMGADFDAFWTWVHQRLFPHNDFWLLDPNTSIMSNMYPTAYWRTILMAGSALFLVILGGIYMDFRRPHRYNATGRENHD